MIACPRCGYQYAQPRLPIAANDNVGVLFVLRDRELLRREHYQYLARRVADLAIASREVPNWMADRIYNYRGAILWPDKQPFVVDDEDIDDTFGHDGSFRWIRSFRGYADRPLGQTPQVRIVRRLRLVDLAVRIDDLPSSPA